MQSTVHTSWPRVLAVVAGASLALAAALLSDAATAQSDSDELVVEASRQVTSSPQPLRLFNTPQVAVHPTTPRPPWWRSATPATAAAGCA